ncbi:hypothetical protein F504_844 [Ralstonia pseudosolanacearum FQY_4]|nr:hypothetical protein F504_844 [Ralstonia pseudosolanacearum FQY_4]
MLEVSQFSQLVGGARLERLRLLRLNTSLMATKRVRLR